MGFKLKYDSTKVDRSKAPTLPPDPGVYRMVIKECTEVPAEGTKGRHLLFIVRMAQNDHTGKGKGYGFWDRVYLTEASAWRLDNYLMAVGIDTTKKAKGTVTEATFLNKEITGRVISGHYNGAYAPELKAVFPPMDSTDGDDEDIDSDEDEDEVDAGVTAVADDDSDDDDDDLDDDEDEDDEDDADSDDSDEDEDDEEDDPAPPPPVKKTTKKATPAPVKAATKKASAPAPEPEEDGDDYESMTREELVEELRGRNLSIKGSVSEKIARLRANDDDPFSDDA